VAGGTVLHAFPVGEVGVVEIGERAEGSPALVDFPVLPLLHRAPEHYIKLYSNHPHATLSHHPAYLQMPLIRFDKLVTKSLDGLKAIVGCEKSLQNHE
jgi:hypothetical protein